MIERINLLPDEIKRARRKAHIRSSIIVFLVIYVAVIVALYLHQRGQIRNGLSHLEGLKREKDLLIEQNIKYKEVIDRISMIKQKEGDIQKRLEIIGFILDERIYWSRVLRAITHLVPEGMWLTSLSTHDLPKGTGKGIRFTGLALSNLHIARLIFAIENSPFFHKVSLSYSQKKEFKGREVYDFEITSELRR
ncbi:MAG: PilN domain-containing protein [Deltaproteobacteria bacterium]|nr:PilN domain-containing protein [Deltaproteobacteria bacterium]